MDKVVEKQNLWVETELYALISNTIHQQNHHKHIIKLQEWQ